MLRNSVPIIAIFALSACQMDVGDILSTPDAGNRPSKSEMRLACEKRAERDGQRVLKIGEFRTVTGSGGREIGAAAPMEVKRDKQKSSVQCNYSFGDGQVRLTALESGPAPADRPTSAEIRGACAQAAEAQDLGVLRVGEFRTVTGSRGREIGAAAVMTVVRDSQVFDMQCNYNFDDRQVRLTQA